MMEPSTHASTEDHDAVRIRRDNLFWGLVFLGLGGVPLLARAGVIDPAAFGDVGRWWPLVLIALGIVLVLGRSRAAILAAALAGLALGIIGGGMLASGTGFLGGIASCGDVGAETTGQRFERSGELDRPTSVRLDLDCGSIDVEVVPGVTWDVIAIQAGDPPRIDAAGDALTVESPGGFATGRQDWQVALPADQLHELEIHSNAGTGTVVLRGAALARFEADLNAGDLQIDATGATVDELTASVNAGRIRVTLGDRPIRGSLQANAGSIELCAPPSAGLRLQVEDQVTFGHNLEEHGLARDGDVWTRPGDAGGTMVELAIEGNAASFTLDPDGGC